MFSKLFVLEWKSFFRSASVGKGIAMKVFIGFLVLYFGLVFLILGMSLSGILQKNFPGEEPIHVVNRFLAVWFLGELFSRFMLQNLPVIHVKPLLVQQIRKRTLVHFVLTKSIFHWINFLSPLLFIPFTLVSMGTTAFSGGRLLAWLFMLLTMVLVLNFLNFIIQKKFADNLKALIPFIVVCAVLAALEYFGIYSSTALFGKAFDYVLIYPYLAVIPFLLLIWLYWANFRHLRDHLYLDTAVRDKSVGYGESNLAWTNRFGALAPFLQLDLRLILRNKRPRSMLMLSLVFVLYGLLFYPDPKFANSTMLVLVGIFVTGIFIINFGQFIPAWDGSYFSMLMAQDIPLRLYLESKIVLMYLSVMILTVLSIPYVYFGWHILMVNLACAVYNLGINVPVVLYFGSFNKKRIELEKGQFLNYQGTGAAQWIVGIPLIFIPMIIWGVTKAVSDQLTASVVLFVLGIIGLLLKKVIVNRIAGAYRERKHGMLEGFRQQG